MKNNKIFWKVFWASTLSRAIMMFLAFIFFFLILFGIIGVISGEVFSKFESSKNIKKNSILKINFNGKIQENPKSELDPLLMKVNSNISLSDILVSLDEASRDNNIEGLYIELGDINTGMASISEIRNAIKKFKESGKFVIAFNTGEVITQKGYYLSSVADKCYGFPTSMFEWIGLNSEKTFFKGLLDKTDIEIQIVRGSDNDFKSAVEPFFLEKMSDSNRIQTERYLNSIWDNMISDISESRGISKTLLNEIANNLYVTRCNQAIKYNLLDGVLYLDQIYDLLAKKTEVNNVDDLRIVKFENYTNEKVIKQEVNNQFSNKNIAVIFAEGEVKTGKGEGIASGKISHYFRKARMDTSIKAIVFRINSPGGSALASEEIWREVYLANNTKPVVVSMGDVAASGGYYIATPTNYIFAEKNTITGSIGVFGIIPYTGKFLKNKLGITFDDAKTNHHSSFSINRKLTKKEINELQKEVDYTYNNFIKKVSEGRKELTQSEVEKIGRGRVWTGSDALKIGLIDKIGGLEDAIAKASELANLTTIKVKKFPRRKTNPFIEILKNRSFNNDDDDENNLKIKNIEIPEEIQKIILDLNHLKSMKGIQARLPYDINIK